MFKRGGVDQIFEDSTINTLKEILNGILRNCHDYGTIKTIQSTSSSINSLFTCPSQYIWRRLCSNRHYSLLLGNPSKRLNQKYFLWEMVYYQNWRLESNWNRGQFVISTLEPGLEMLHQRPIYNQTNDSVIVVSEVRPLKCLLKLLNDGSGFALSVPIEANGFWTLWDVKRGMKLDRKPAEGLQTCSFLHQNILFLGKESGEIEIRRLFRDEALVIKNHSHEISSIKYDQTRCMYISSDISGLIVSFSLGSSTIPKVLFENQTQGITASICMDGKIFATSCDGSLLILGLKTRRRIRFDYGAINCITSIMNSTYIVFGTDFSKVILFNTVQNSHLEVQLASADCKSEEYDPITTMASDKSRLAVGLYSGKILLFSIERINDNQVMLERTITLTNHKGPIWSLGIGDATLISSSLDGTTILRTFL